MNFQLLHDLRSFKELRLRTFVKSIRLKFFLWYTLILTITFCLFSLALYHNFRHNLRKELDNRLHLKAEGIERSIETYWETEKLEASKYGSIKYVFNKINNANFAKIALRWVNEKSNKLDLMNIIVQIYNSNGEIVAPKEKALEPITLPDDILKHIVQGNSHYDDYTATINEKEIPFRVFSLPVFESDKVAYVVQVASPLSPINTVLNRLKFLLFLLLPLTVIITGAFAGEFLASITLKPLNQMIETVRQITAQKMKLRITLPETKDEIKQLAETFNNMLEKVDNSLTAEKQFIQDLSHELKTPLTIIKGELETTLKKERSPDEYIATLNSNLEEIDKISKMVEKLLILARFDNESMQLKMEPLDLVLLLKELTEDLHIMADQKDIRIDFDPPTTPARLVGDKVKLQQVFLNIIDNAVKYTPKKGSIRLELMTNTDHICVKISDTGIGISEADIPFIFNRFYRADKSRSSIGFGLGLSIAKSITEAHGGKITVNSTLNAGSIFILTFPIHTTKP
ncbi:MAG: HAMP domain-containing protein [Candidatus Aureabacteria bacterium]|nr:HAMP domain-containing protein [Candidatus Auribacterota bacterium]